MLYVGKGDDDDDDGNDDDDDDDDDADDGNDDDDDDDDISRILMLTGAGKRTLLLSFMVFHLIVIIQIIYMYLIFIIEMLQMTIIPNDQVITCGISMFICNTATCAMMCPILKVSMSK